MHPDEAAFLKAVCAAPDDDLPRLVYADWLDEHDRPLRAEFIRTQIELAKLTPQPEIQDSITWLRWGTTWSDDPRRKQLALRARQLEEEHGSGFIAPPLDPKRCRFHRGMVEAAEFWNWSDESADVYRFNPIRRVWLRSDSLASKIPEDNHLTALDLTGSNILPEMLWGIGRSRRFPHLRELTLVGCGLADDAVRELCDRPLYQQLSRLILGANPFSDDGRRRLRDHFGERVWFDSLRDPDRWCVLSPSVGLSVGFGSDDTQLLLAVSHDGYQCGVFDHDGNAIRFVEECQLPEGEPAVRGMEFIRSLGFRPATIRVKRFMWPGGRGVGDYPSSRLRLLDGPSATEYEAGQDWLFGWLADGAYKISWGAYSDRWINRDGEGMNT